MNKSIIITKIVIMIIKYYRSYFETYTNVIFKITDTLIYYDYLEPEQHVKYFREIENNITTDKTVNLMKEKWYISNCTVMENKNEIIISGECTVENNFNNPEIYQLSKNICIDKSQHEFCKIVINDCLACSKEKEMYSDYHICSDCYKLFYQVNKNNKKYVNDLDTYLRILNRTGLWKKNGLPNNVQVPVFSGFIK